MTAADRSVVRKRLEQKPPNEASTSSTAQTPPPAANTTTANGRQRGMVRQHLERKRVVIPENDPSSE